jgi:hypothetical protein
MSSGKIKTKSKITPKVRLTQHIANLPKSIQSHINKFKSKTVNDATALSIVQ